MAKWTSDGPPAAAASELVSVVIPAYNYGRFLKRAIDSVLTQTYPHRECIVIDDGSDDDTPAVIASYGDRIRSVRTNRVGLSRARNTGIELARGTLVAFLDADDWWRPEKLAVQTAFLAAHPDVALVGCGIAVVEPDGRLRGEFPAARAQARGSRSLQLLATRRFRISGSGSGAVIRRHVLQEVGLFDPGLPAAEDWDLWLRVAARYPVDNVPEVLATLHQHGTGGFRNPRLMADNQWRVYHRAAAAWPDVLNWRIRLQMRALILGDAGGEYLAQRHYGAALRHYFAAAAVLPVAGHRWVHIVKVLRRWGLDHLAAPAVR